MNYDQRIVIKIIEGSTRPGRFNTQPAEWIYEIARRRPDIDKTVILDLQKINLPFLDEPIPPVKALYTKEHTKKWAAEIEEADGFIFVTPEYNHSFPAPLKNAIDYLFYEWNYKPVGFVSYGSLAGGARAVEHLRTVVSEVKMYDLREQVLFSNYWEHLDENGKYRFTLKNEQAAEEMLDALVFWSADMQAARQRLGMAQQIEEARTPVE